MNLPTTPQVVAFGRHVVTFSMGAVAAAAALHVVSSNDAASLGGAVNQISTGVGNIVTGVTTIIGIASAVWAAWTASPFRQLLAVAANPDVKAVVTVPTTAGKALANAAPANVTVAK